MFRRRKLNLNKATDIELYNYALDLAQEWGENWMTPVNKRLKELYPILSDEKVDHISSLVDNAMKESYEICSNVLDGNSTQDSYQTFLNLVKSKYNWIDDNNASRLYRIGTYYHFK
jgi:hypothetical protein